MQKCCRDPGGPGFTDPPAQARLGSPSFAPHLIPSNNPLWLSLAQEAKGPAGRASGSEHPPGLEPRAKNSLSSTLPPRPGEVMYKLGHAVRTPRCRGHLPGLWLGLSCLLRADLGAPEGLAAKSLASEGHALRNGVSVITRISSVGWKQVPAAPGATRRGSFLLQRSTLPAPSQLSREVLRAPD